MTDSRNYGIMELHFKMCLRHELYNWSDSKRDKLTRSDNSKVLSLTENYLMHEQSWQFAVDNL